MYKPNKPHSTRIELRSPDSACNPYLAFAVILAAGLRGIEEGYTLDDAPQNDFNQSDALLAAGLTPLPSDLNEAITAMAASELVRETLGEHVFEYVLRNKRAEWAEYERQVSMYEIDRYLPTL
jgi:glutamine synthetase